MIARSTSPGVFKWGQVFQRGDLPIFITDLANNPVSPFKVTYTLFYVGSGCARQVGPADRVPVQADVGEYYVSGVAGECAQPGDWLVEWSTRSPSARRASRTGWASRCSTRPSTSRQ